MGEVCLAVSQGAAGFKKLVVLKHARADMIGQPEILAMFLDEARLAARLNHPNVVQTYEAGEEAGRYYIAMEYLDGQSLYRIQKRVGPKDFPLAMQIRIISETLSGLHYAHELTDYDGTPLGMVHRDASPQNIFVTYDGQVKVVDFGMAKAASSMTKTRMGMLKGKVTYMAAEQARLEPVDRRADIFAVGVILWEALACVRMWQGLSDGAIIRRLASGVLPSPPADAPNADPVLRRICRRALDPVPTNRYATAAEMQYELEGWLKRHGDDVTARMVGNFVAMSFDKERTAVKALLEQELRGSSRSKGTGPGRPRLASEGPEIGIQIESQLSSLMSSSDAGLVSTASASPTHQASATTGSTLAPADAALQEQEAPQESSVSVDITEQLSSLASSSDAGLVSTASAGPTHQASTITGSMLAPANAALQEQEAPQESSVSVDITEQFGSAQRAQPPIRKSMAIGSAVVVVGAVAVTSLTFGAPFSWLTNPFTTATQVAPNPGLPLTMRTQAAPDLGSRQAPGALPPQSTASVNSPAPADSAPGTANAAGAVGYVAVTIGVRPLTARIFLDGALVSTGYYKGKLAKDGREHRIRVEAPGYLPVEQPIAASGAVIVNLSLERQSAPAP
jgi:serine/threonine protein kinase